MKTSWKETFNEIKSSSISHMEGEHASRREEERKEKKGMEHRSRKPFAKQWRRKEVRQF